MSTYQYKALQANGAETSGEIEASDRSEAYRKLSHKRLQPLQLIESSAKGGGGGGREGRKRIGRRRRESNQRDEGNLNGSVRLSSGDIILFSDEVADLLASDVGIEAALNLIARRGEKSRIREVAQLALERIGEGDDLSVALKRSSPSFGDLYCNLIAAGEQAGALEPLLRRQVEYLTTMKDLRSQVITSLIYPFFLIFSTIIVTVMFVTFLIPRLSDMIETTGSEPPLPVRLMISGSEFLSYHGLTLLGGVILCGVVFVSLIRSERFQAEWHRIRLGIPIVGPLEKSGFYVHVLETLSNVLANDVHLSDALNLSKGITNNLYLRTRLEEVMKAVQQGDVFSRAMEAAEIFPAKLVDLVRVGEETGRLKNSLAKAAARYQKELGLRMERITQMIQPALILLMAGMVGTMAYMMISTIYQTISLLRPGG